jgi:ABC-type multidrug transport system ATPase subunit
MQRVVREEAASGRAVCVVEHNVSFIRDLCSRAVFMANGKILQDGTVDELSRADQPGNRHDDGYRRTKHTGHAENRTWGDRAEVGTFAFRRCQSGTGTKRRFVGMVLNPLNSSPGRTSRVTRTSSAVAQGFLSGPRYLCAAATSSVEPFATWQQDARFR